MRWIEETALAAVSFGTCISGFSLSKQLYTFSKVFMRMYSHSLQEQPTPSVTSGGTGINSLSGHARCISNRIPLSVAIIKRLEDDLIVCSSRALVEPITSLCAKIGALHSGCANTSTPGLSFLSCNSASHEKRLCTWQAPFQRSI